MKYVKLSDVAEINPKPEKSVVNAAKKVSFVAMADVSEQTCTVVSEADREVAEVSKGFTYFANGDVLLAKITPCFENGKVAIADIRNEFGFGSTEFHVFKANPDLLDSRYLYFLLRTPAFKIEGAKNMTGSAGQKRVPKAFLESFKIPLPPLNEQKRIAQVLDKVDRLRQKDRQLLAHYDQLLQSVFLDMFGDLDLNDKEWKVKELGEALANIQIGPFGSLLHVEDYVTGGVPLVNPTHIKNLKIHPDNNFTVSPEKYNDLKNYHLKTGDVVLGRRGEMGRCALVTEKENGWLCGTGSLFLTPSKSISSVYLTYLLSRESVKKRLEKEAKGTTMPNLNRTIIRNFKVPVPPIEIQEKFTVFTLKLEHQLELLQKNINLTELLFQSLLQKAFKGELQLKEVKAVEESLV